MTAVLEVENLEVEIINRKGNLLPVRGISLNVNRGEILGIVGESGCGKSLTSLSIMRLLPKKIRHRAKSIKIAGNDIQQLSERRMADIRGNQIAMIFQEPMSALNPLLSIGEQLTEVYLRHGCGNYDQSRNRAIELLEKVGIDQPEWRFKQFPHELSGGMCQRVVIAMALMCEPELIIADEPTTALDVTIQLQVLDLFKTLQKELGLTMVIITHDLGVVAHIADRVLVMYGGEIVESADSSELFSNPVHPYSKGLLSCLPQPGKKEQLGTIPGTVPSFTPTSKGCGFANRCSLVSEICRKEQVPLQHAATDHQYRCLLNTEQLALSDEGRQ